MHTPRTLLSNVMHIPSENMDPIAFLVYAFSCSRAQSASQKHSLHCLKCML